MLQNKKPKEEASLDRPGGFELFPLPMASNTKKTKAKRKRRHKNMGRVRKAAQAQKSTLTAEELFAGCGEPGKPAPAASSAA